MGTAAGWWRLQRPARHGAVEWQPAGRRSRRRRRPMIHVAPAGTAGTATLSSDERRRITTRLGAGLTGIGLLGLGTLLLRLAPDQWQAGELCRATAATSGGV